jgi:hypothetical protein
MTSTRSSFGEAKLAEDTNRLAHDARQMKTLPALIELKIGFDL